MPHDAAFNSSEPTCCGVMQEATYNARQKRAQRQATPQPWIVLKLALIITVGIIVYASYVYIGRFCVPMLRRDSNALGNRTYGIVFLAVFSVLLIILFWCYAKVAFTSPGHAKNHIERSPRPLAQSWGSNTELSGMPYEYQNQIDSPVAGSSGEKADVAVPHVLDYTGGPSATNPKGSLYARRPPTTAVLLPEHRYCTRESIVKPYRAHHCSACGCCVLKYDHHCPWIGQCVGARNHKFFVNFVHWAFLFCAWIFATLIALNVRPKPVTLSRNITDIDPQHIAIMAISGFFGLFTGTLAVTHIRLICLNLSTLEHVKLVQMQEVETALLGQMFSCWEFGEKQRTKREWDEHWGDLSTEGNIWWLGSSRRNWESVMGKNIWGWILPIGRSESDGLEYPINPRFDRDGRWRRRSEWPEELR